LSRLGELLCLPADETEKHLSDLVTSKKVSAKIDRPGGVVDFKTQAQGADWLLNQWVGKIDKLLNTLDKANHLIHKEAMAHKVSLEA
jgi:26S proteasome regulatory subunit N5